MTSVPTVVVVFGLLMLLDIALQAAGAALARPWLSQIEATIDAQRDERLRRVLRSGLDVLFAKTAPLYAAALLLGVSLLLPLAVLAPKSLLKWLGDRSGLTSNVGRESDWDRPEFTAFTLKMFATSLLLQPKLSLLLSVALLPIMALSVVAVLIIGAANRLIGRGRQGKLAAVLLFERLISVTIVRGR